MAKESDQAIRSFLLENFEIDAIIIRSDGYNFSENTNLTEILLLGTKTKPASDHLTRYIFLKTLDSNSAEVVNHVLKTGYANEEIDNPNFRSVTLRQSGLDKTNLFIPISLSDYWLANVWKGINRSSLISSTKDLHLSLEEGLRSRQGGKYPECGLSTHDTIGLGNRDTWIVKEELDNVNFDTIAVRHRRNTPELNIPEFIIPAKSISYGLRNTDNRCSFDVSNVQDSIILEGFNGFDEFAIYAQLDDYNLNKKWKDWVIKRSVNLAVIETLHIEAPNTYFFAYYSKSPRAFSSKFWNVKTTIPR